MADATAQLSNYRQSPRKVGRVASTVRGKRVPEAIAILELSPKRATGALVKLIRSAAANAQSKGIMSEELVVSRLMVGKGITYKRSNPRARGSAALIRKKASHVSVELTKVQPKPKAKKAKTVKVAPAAKAEQAETVETDNA